MLNSKSLEIKGGRIFWTLPFSIHFLSPTFGNQSFRKALIVQRWYGCGMTTFGNRCLATETECCFDASPASTQVPGMLLSRLIMVQEPQLTTGSTGPLAGRGPLKFSGSPNICSSMSVTPIRRGRADIFQALQV